MRQSRWRVARDYREAEEYHRDWKVSQFVTEKIKPWLESVLRTEDPIVNVVRSGVEIDPETGAISWLPERMGGRLTITPDYVVTRADGKQTVIEFQYSAKLRRNYDFKRNKVEKAIQEGVEFLYLVKPVNSWALLSPEEIKVKGREVIVSAWGNKPAYRVDHEDMGFEVDDRLGAIWTEVDGYVERLDLSVLGKLQVNVEIWDSILVSHHSGARTSGREGRLSQILRELRLLEMVKDNSVKLVQAMELPESDKGILSEIVIPDLDVAGSVDSDLFSQLSSKGQAVSRVFERLAVPAFGGIVREVNSFRSGAIYQEPRQSASVSTAYAVLTLATLGVLPPSPAETLDAVRELHKTEKDKQLANMLVAAEQELLSLWGKLY